MPNQTGFEKFVQKQTEGAVQIRPKSNTTPSLRRNPEGEGSTRATAFEQPRAEKETPRRGRPARDRSAEPKQVTINFQIDEELKQILENLKYRTHKSTIKGVVLEAIDLLLDKYGIER